MLLSLAYGFAVQGVSVGHQQGFERIGEYEIGYSIAIRIRGKVREHAGRDLLPRS